MDSTPPDLPLDRLLASWRDAFRDRRPTVWASAPGRVNLIGEHTDYHDGFVLPVAIDLKTRVLAAPRADRTVCIRSDNLDEILTFDLEELDPERLPRWGRYVAGPAWALAEAGLEPSGLDAVVWGDVPFGGGLSSSASVEVAFVALWDRLGGWGLSPARMATLARKAENGFVGVPCGIMDQWVVASCEPGAALLLDCRSLDARPVTLPADWRIVVCDTGVHHELASSEYALRQQECAQGLEVLRRREPGLESLRDVDADLLDASRGDLDEVAWRRCTYVLAENARTVACADALAAGDAEAVGCLMAESHAGLRDDYEVSCAELDRAVALAQDLPGLIGARMTGGGFGGCTVNLVWGEHAPAFAEALEAAYRRASGGTGGVRLLAPGGGVEAGPLPG